MYNKDRSNPTLTNCTFTNNSASDFGGGMCNDDRCQPTLDNCTFTSNSAAYGGGMCSLANNQMPPSARP